MSKSILVCGQAGQGIQSVGYIFAKSLVRCGYYVFAWQDFQSRIRGGETSFRIVADDKPVKSLPEKYDLIVSLDKKNTEVYSHLLLEDGVILLQEEEYNGKGNSYIVPFLKIAKEIGGKEIYTNAAAIGAVAAVIGLNPDILHYVLRENFRDKGEESVNGNINICDYAFNIVEKDYRGKKLNLTKLDSGARLLLSGIEGLSLGAIAAGAKFMSAYPMTPSTGLITYLAATSDKTGILTEQAEDEIAAINMAIGASYAGARSLTATSGGGFSLMVEGLALAGMTEIPLVIALGQRPGPATGLPTRTEQGELNFSIYAGHGEFPRFIFAPSDAHSCYNLMIKAFELSQKYRVPSIVLYDQYIADSYWTVDKEKICLPEIKNYFARTQDIKGEYRSFEITDDGISPRLYPGQGDYLVIVDSDEHDEYGHITEDLTTRKLMVEKRWKKFSYMEKEMNVILPDNMDKADLLLISWGSNAGPAEKAAEILIMENINVVTINYEHIWPLIVPERLKEFSGRVVVVENNFTGQFADIIASRGLRVDKKILKYNGLPFTAEEIAVRIKEWLN